MGGIRQISGVRFEYHNDMWISVIDGINLVLNWGGAKCALIDTMDHSEYFFKTVFAAHSFAKRKRHGRTLEEHQRAELLTATRERLGWSVKDAAGTLMVSPRTVEAWSSGCRVVPVSVFKKLCEIRFK